MTSRVASLRLQLIDAASGPAKKTSGALGQLERDISKLGKNGVAGAKNLGNQLDHLRRKAAAAADFGRLRQNAASTFAEFRTARDRVKQLEAALQSVSKPTAKMNADLRSARSALKGADNAFRQSRAAAVAAGQGLKTFGLNSRTAANAQESLRRSMALTIRKMRDMERESRKPQRPNRPNLPGHSSPMLDAAVTAGGSGALRTTMRAATAGAHQEAAANRILNVSNSPAEVVQARAIGADVSRQYPTTSIEQSMHDYVEFRSLAGTGNPDAPIDYQKMRRDSLAIAKARASLNAGGYELTEQDVRNLALTVEGSGRAGDPNAIEDVLNAFVRGKQVFGTGISSDSLRDFVANAKSANFSMSDPAFYGSTIARLAQGNASRLGNETAQVMSTLVGGRMTKQGANWLADAGLIGKDQIKSGGGGKFFIEGEIKSADLLSTDPTAWAQQVLMPALKQAGVLDTEKINKRTETLRKADPTADPHVLEERAVHGLVADSLAKSGFRATVTDFLSHAIGNELITARGVQMMSNAQGLGAADSLGKNPVAAFGELTTAVTNFGAVLTSPAMQSAGEMMHSFAGGLTSITDALQEWQKTNPDAAKAAGGAAVAGGAAAGGWLTWKGVNGLWRGVTGRSAATAAAERAAGGIGGGILARGAGLAGRIAASPLGAGALTAATLNQTDPEGNLWGLTSGVDAWVEKHTGINPSNVQLGRKRTPQEALEVDISQQTAQWPIAAQQGIREYIGVLMTGGAEAEAKAQVTGEQIKEALTVNGALTIDTSQLERALGLARQFATVARGGSAAVSSSGGSLDPKLDGKRAAGGPVKAGGIYQINEKGQELFAPGADGTIIPNHKIGGGGVTVHAPINLGGITVGAGADAASVKAAVQQGVEQALAQLEGKLARSVQTYFGNLSYGDA